MTNHKSRGERRSPPEAVAGATEDVSLVARWLKKRLYGGRGFVSCWGQRNITISYARSDQGGGGVLWLRRKRKEQLAKIARK